MSDGPTALSVQTRVLDAAYEAHGPEGGDPVILLHGFPYDPRAFDAVAPALADRGRRVIVPYLRGYGPTRYRSAGTLRSGQQAALGQDLIDLMDALELPSAALAGFDWGGRAACIVAALWPERARSLVTVDGYNIHDIARLSGILPPETEHRLWYQTYFNTERGRVGLEANRAAIGRFLWSLWSPSWRFDEATYARTAASFDNPDFVDTVIHSYRHRCGAAAGDPELEPIERSLAAKPVISVPTISLCGADDMVHPPSETDHDARRFSGPYERRLLTGVGHNVPQEAPAAFAAAVLEMMSR